MASLDFFLVQSDQDRERLTALGVDAGKVTVTGNMKLDLLALEVPKKEEREALRKKLGFQSQDLVLIGGDVFHTVRLGKLRTLYGAVDVAVMGGSFVPHGGQNPVEPAAARRPILHGPWVFNFEDLYRRLDEAGAGLGVSGEEQLVFVLKRILRNECEKENLGRRAFEVLEKLRGATERNLKGVRPFLASEKGVTTHVS